MPTFNFAPAATTPEVPKLTFTPPPAGKPVYKGEKMAPAERDAAVKNLFDPAPKMQFDNAPKLAFEPAKKESWFQPFNDIKEYTKKNVKEGVKTIINPEPVMEANPAGKPATNYEQAKAGSPPIRPGTPGPDTENKLLTNLERPLGALGVATAPMFSFTHALVSKPLERMGGPKAEYTDLARMFTPMGAAAALGGATRVKNLVQGEKITAAAVKDGERIVEGANHAEAYSKLGKTKDASLPEGFVTNKGRFIPREEAAALAKKNKQAPVNTVEEGKLHSEDIAKAKGLPPEKGIPQKKTVLQKGARAIESIFSPTTMSKDASTAEGIVRSARGEAERATMQAQQDINGISKEVNALPPDEQRAFVNYIETRSTGGQLKNPALQKAADTIRGVYQRTRSTLENSSATQKMGFVTDYFVHQWKNPEKAQAFVQDWVSKAGSGKSTQRRTIPTLEDGIKAGLEPVHENPLDATMHYVANMENYLAVKNIQEGMKAQGIRKFYPRGAQPPGWVALKGPGNELIYTTGDGEKGVKAGVNVAYAPEDAARVYNRYLSPGFTGPTGDLYRMMRSVVNAPTQLVLGLSGYHYRLIANETTASAFGQAFGQLAKGDVKGAAKSLAKAIPFYGAASQAAEGRQIEKEYLGADTKINSKVVDVLTKAGARMTGIDKTMKASESNNFWEAFKKGTLKAEAASGIKEIRDAGLNLSGAAKTFGFVAKNIGKLMDTVAYPLFAKTIPYIKNSVNYDAVNDWIKANPTASEEEITKAAHGIVDSTDNRFGEMIQDNLFWDKKLKQSLQLMVLSVGWDVGTMREMVGGTKDLGRLIGEGGELTPRAKYLLGAPVAHMLNASVYQYLKTGEAPQAPQDLVYPQTGGTVTESPGTKYQKTVPERLRLPSQENDIIGYQESPLHELEGKMAPVWKMAWNMANNEDWRGDPISYQYEQSAPQGLKAYAQYVLQSLTPISVSNIDKRKKGTAISPVESAVLGSNPTGMRQRDPEGFRKMQESITKKKEKAGVKHIKADQKSENPSN